jgi:hypothetical protein
MRAGQEIRDADGETDDVATGGFQSLGFLGNGHNGGGFSATDALGKLRHGVFPLSQNEAIL